MVRILYSPMEYFFHYLFPTLFLAVGLSRLSISYGIRDLQRIRHTTKSKEACKDVIMQRLVSDGYQVQESEKRLNFSKGKKHSIMVQFHDNKGKKVTYSITASPKSLKEAKSLLPTLDGEPERPLSYRLTRKELVPVIVTGFGVLLLMSAIRTPVISTPSYSTPPSSPTRTTNTTRHRPYIRDPSWKYRTGNFMNSTATSMPKEQ